MSAWEFKNRRTMTNNSIAQTLSFTLIALFSIFMSIDIFFASAATHKTDHELNPIRIIEEARKIALNIRMKSFEYFPDQDKIEILKDVAVAQAKVGDRAGAVKTFNQLIEMVISTNDISPDLPKLREMNKSNLPKNHDFAKEDERNLAWGKIRLLIDIALAQAKAQEFVGARGTFKRAVQIAHEIPNDYRHSNGKIFALKEIAIAQIRSGDSDGVKATLKNAFQAMEILKEKRMLIDEGYELFKISFLMHIAKAWAQVGDRVAAGEVIQKSLKIAQQIKDRHTSSLAFRDIAIAQGGMGDRQEAMKTVQKLFDARTIDARTEVQTPKDVALHNIIDFLNVTLALIEGGKLEGAEEDINKAIEMMKAIEKEGRSSVWRKIAVIRAQLGDIAGAFAAESEISDRSFRGESIPFIADAQIKAEDFSEAHRTADRVRGVDRQDILKKIAIAQTNIGDINGAMHTLELLCCSNRESRSRSEALREIARVRASTADVKEGFTWALGQSSPQEKVYALLGLAEGVAK